MAFDFSYPNIPANERGWGPGYPNCQTDKWVPLKAANGVSFGSVHRRIHDLLELLLAECVKKGYPPKAGQCWGAVCRCSHRSDGTCAEDSAGNPIPSNHSWGLAIDYNSLDNVYGATSGVLQKHPAIVQLFHDYGFRWLGPPIHDWQHFDFCGTPTDADRMLKKAKANGIGAAPKPIYKVGTHRFHRLRRALAYVRTLLKKGKDAAVRVIRRG